MTESISSTIDRLIEIAEGLRCSLAGVSIYLFGSALADDAGRHDTDVLIVYPVGALPAATALATRFRQIEVLPPIEVIALSLDEEQEKSFIAAVAARQVWSLV